MLVGEVERLAAERGAVALHEERVGRAQKLPLELRRVNCGGHDGKGDGGTGDNRGVLSGLSWSDRRRPKETIDARRGHGSTTIRKHNDCGLERTALLIGCLYTLYTLRYSRICES